MTDHPLHTHILRAADVLYVECQTCGNYTYSNKPNMSEEQFAQQLINEGFEQTEDNTAILCPNCIENIEYGGF